MRDSSIHRTAIGLASRSRLGLVSPLVVVLASQVSANSPQQQAFRGGVTLTSVEVRVTRNGTAVPGLTAADFTVRENGVEQQISHFELIDLNLNAHDPGTVRTFAIVLGRGQLEIPTRALQALIDFIRLKSLPTDRFIIVAYLRAIGPTSNRQSLIRFLERYREYQAAIEAKIRRDLRGARPPVLASDTRQAIDAVFPTHLPVENLAAGSGSRAAVYYDAYYLKAALAFLRVIAGEKTVIVFSEAVLDGGSGSPLENYWTKQAISAKASLHFIHTGGVTGASAPDHRRAQAATARQTGGTATFFESATKPLEVIDRTTRQYYLVGYYPLQESPPDAYRRIDVSVRRADVVVNYRQGFQAQAAPPDSPEYRETNTTDRLNLAAAQLIDPALRPPVSELMPAGIVWKMRLDYRSQSADSLEVTVSFDPSLTEWSREGETHKAELDLMLIADDAGRNPVAQTRERLRISLTPSEFARTKRQWPTFDFRLAVRGRASYVRAVLYQFDTDRVASAQVRLPSRRP
jgi:VWFA-related protein